MTICILDCRPDHYKKNELFNSLVSTLYRALRIFKDCNKFVQSLLMFIVSCALKYIFRFNRLFSLESFEARGPTSKWEIYTSWNCTGGVIKQVLKFSHLTLDIFSFNTSFEYLRQSLHIYYQLPTKTTSLLKSD